MAKYIFVTGGVVSSLGKGITAASLGRLLKSRGIKVTIQKFDPYINIDPGTMSPYQHGEVFVTDDGAETDLDLGHYERFIDINLTKNSNITTGKVYWSVLNKERKGEYLGSTVQVIPHITNEIKQKVYDVAKADGADVVIQSLGDFIGAKGGIDGCAGNDDFFDEFAFLARRHAVINEVVLKRQGAACFAFAQDQAGAQCNQQRRGVANRGRVANVAAQGALIADLQRGEALQQLAKVRVFTVERGVGVGQ